MFNFKEPKTYASFQGKLLLCGMGELSELLNPYLSQILSYILHLEFETVEHFPVHPVCSRLANSC